MNSRKIEIFLFFCVFPLTVTPLALVEGEENDDSGDQEH